MKRIDANRLLIPAEGPMNVDALVYASEKIRLEEGALRQLRDAASLPSVHKALATPDIHVGFGVPIGCVVGLRDIVVPAAVGYDINCGMRLLTTPVRRGEMDPVEVAQSIRRDVPLGEGKKNLRLTLDELDVVLARGVKGVREIAGETGRIWLLFAPWLAAGAGPALLDEETRDPRPLIIACALTALQLLLMAWTMQPIMRLY